MIDRTREGDVFAGFCHNGSVAACFMFSLLNAFAADQEQASWGGRRRLIEFHEAAGPYIYDNRCRIVEYFLDHTDKQWLWFLDNDMQFAPDTHLRMLALVEEHDLKLVGAAYWNAYGSSARAVSWIQLFKDHGIKAIPELPDSTDPWPVSALGMGCTLIHRDVLQDVSDMYAEDTWKTFAADTLLRFDDGNYMTGRVPEDWEPHLNGRKVVKRHIMGEDVSFCLRARRAGYQAYGLPTVIVDHFKPIFVPQGNSDLNMAHGREGAEAPREAVLNAAV